MFATKAVLKKEKSFYRALLINLNDLSKSKNSLISRPLRPIYDISALLYIANMNYGNRHLHWRTNA